MKISPTTQATIGGICLFSGAALKGCVKYEVIKDVLLLKAATVAAVAFAVIGFVLVVTAWLRARAAAASATDGKPPASAEQNLAPPPPPAGNGSSATTVLGADGSSSASTDSSAATQIKPETRADTDSVSSMGSSTDTSTTTTSGTGNLPIVVEAPRVDRPSDASSSHYNNEEELPDTDEIDDPNDAPEVVDCNDPTKETSASKPPAPSSLALPLPKHRRLIKGGSASESQIVSHLVPKAPPTKPSIQKSVHPRLQRKVSTPPAPPPNAPQPPTDLPSSASSATASTTTVSVTDITSAKLKKTPTPPEKPSTPPTSAAGKLINKTSIPQHLLNRQTNVATSTFKWD